MPGDPRPKELFVEKLPLLHELVGLIARRYRLEPDQLDDLESFVRLRMIENDFAILAGWRRTSSLRTYLTVVIHRLGRLQQSRLGQMASLGLPLPRPGSIVSAYDDAMRVAP